MGGQLRDCSPDVIVWGNQQFNYGTARWLFSGSGVKGVQRHNHTRICASMSGMQPRRRMPLWARRASASRPYKAMQRMGVAANVADLVAASDVAHVAANGIVASVPSCAADRVVARLGSSVAAHAVAKLPCKFGSVVAADAGTVVKKFSGRTAFASEELAANFIASYVGSRMALGTDIELKPELVKIVVAGNVGLVAKRAGRVVSLEIVVVQADAAVEQTSLGVGSDAPCVAALPVLGCHLLVRVVFAKQGGDNGPKHLVLRDPKPKRLRCVSPSGRGIQQGSRYHGKPLGHVMSRCSSNLLGCSRLGILNIRTLEHLLHVYPQRSQIGSQPRKALDVQNLHFVS